MPARVAAGAFASAHHVVLFGAKSASAPRPTSTVALAGTLGYLVGASSAGRSACYGGRPLLERHGSWLHLTPEKLDRAERWFERWGDSGRPPRPAHARWSARSSRSRPACSRCRSCRYTALTLHRLGDLGFALAGVGYGLGSSYEQLPPRLPLRRYAVVAASSRSRRISDLRGEGRLLSRRADPAR